MATQVHINDSNISEMIAAAVKEAVQQVTKEVLEAKAVENKDHGFNIHHQILANARWLWKVARSYHVQEEDPKGEPGISSWSAPLTIIVGCAQGGYVAEVRLQQSRDNRHIH
ncbi:hypothetical protein LTR97_004041 [Elasticomyces elasticus]|uniref:Uncharacterized protein n=1 Tax=Elasticomyces elasticus TaxID=574655 RepID=A0AAN7W8I3_9PEZI|nr:hypothetical protein LTR97_004041 [Elasticomyces elasticus]